MKNRVLRSLMTLMMVVALAGPAAAAWENNLVGVFYNPNPGGFEWGFDLGPVADVTAAYSSGDTLQLAAPGTLSLSLFPSGTEWSDLKFGAFSNAGANVDGGAGYFVTTKDTPTSVISAVSVNGFASTATLTTDVWVIGDPTVAQSSAGNFTSAGQGSYSSVNQGDAALGVVGLGDFANPESNIIADLYLWKFTVAGNATRAKGTLVPEYQATLHLLADGSIVANANPVPVPGAIVLLGSGLLALVGIRRKVS